MCIRDRLDGEATLQMLKKARGVTDGVYYHYVPATLLADANLYADSMLRVYDIDAETASVYGEMCIRDSAGRGDRNRRLQRACPRRRECK